MKIIFQVILFLFSSSFCFAQEMTKRELKNMIKESKLEYRKNGYSYFSKILTNNKDSLFFKADRIEIYSSNAITSEKGICRTVELKFLKNKKVNFIDCQTCTEPSSCYVTTDKNVYKYYIQEIENELFILFKNKYYEMNFKVISAKENELNHRKYREIKLERIE
ncbi:hypothetical protein [uncultured Winogradskyella sp.]|uniref:hypothetical protein n=1 Tax=uncultured Winogradskyella sp. TaxID=395353 RepID=UPI0035155C85